MDVIGSKDETEISTSKAMSGKEIADLLQELDNASHYNSALGDQQEPQKVLQAPAAPDSKYMERLQTGFDHIFAVVRDMNKMHLSAKGLDV